MSQQLQIVHSADSYFGGAHTRNRKVTNWTTCATCPGERKQECSSVCADMERYLAANGKTITHNSPTSRQAVQTVEEMTTPGTREDAGHVRSLSSIHRDNPHVSVTTTPESLLIAPEEEQAGETRVLKLISAFSKKESEGDLRKRSILEAAIVLYCLERYSVPRVCELLNMRFSGFDGYTETVRKTGPKAGTVVMTSKSAYKVRRIVQRFARYIRRLRLSPRFEK